MTGAVRREKSGILVPSVATDEDDVVDGAVVHLGFLASSHGNVPLLNLSTIHIC